MGDPRPNAYPRIDAPDIFCLSPRPALLGHAEPSNAGDMGRMLWDTLTVLGEGDERQRLGRPAGEV